MDYLKKIWLLILLLTFPVLSTFAQTTEIDTLKFSTETGLLVFKGFLNGIETNFAFDTGTSRGILNKQHVIDSKIKNSGTREVFDSNKQLLTLTKGTIKTLVIGHHSFNDITSMVYDMPFLSCNNLYVLGADVINKLNWKFDFERNLVYISKKQFEPTKEMVSFPVTYETFRHYTNIMLNGSAIPCLIDFGYVKNFEVSRSNLVFREIEAKKKDKILYSKTFTMALTSNSIGQTMASLFIDSVALGNFAFNRLQIDIKDDTETKIGLNFFKTHCSAVIMNNDEAKYWVLPSNQQPDREFGYDAYCMLTNGKLEVVEKTLNQETTAKSLEIGEQIKSLNGKTVADLRDFCTLIKWQIDQRAKKEIIFEKMNGEIVVIKKAFIPH